MRSLAASLVVITVGSLAVLAASPQNPPAAAPRTDIYHVHFTKAVPGQADALGKALAAPDPTAPMPDHIVVLRHQEGDSWDYAVLQHLGQKAVVEAAPMPPNPARDMRAWHNDTFASGPAWPDFRRAMGLDESAGGAGMVYAIATHRAVPGHREQLEKTLTQAPQEPNKIQTGTVFMQHLEGGDWTFLTVTRYNSWQDLAADRAAAMANPAAAGGWAEIRQHADFHRDTIADRIFPIK